MDVAFIEDNDADYFLFTQYLDPVFKIERFHRFRDFLSSGHKFDLVVSDLGLPDSWGPETTGELKKLSCHLVIFTGIGKPFFEETKICLSSQGFGHVLTKDMNPHDFACYLKEKFL